MRDLEREANCLVQKFLSYTTLNEAEIALLNGLQVDEIPHNRGGIVHRDGADSSHLHVVKAGWFARIKELSDGRRAITEIAVPGDVVGLRDITFQKHFSALQCLSNNAVICPFSKAQLHALFARSLKLTETFFAILSREHAQLVQRLITVSRRAGVCRLAHLILEIATRLEGICIDIQQEFAFPLDQREIGDLTGMSSVHVSRCMTELRTQSLIDYSKDHMHILDRHGLQALAEFDASFLKPDIDWLRSIDAPNLQ